MYFENTWRDISAELISYNNNSRILIKNMKQPFRIPNIFAEFFHHFKITSRLFYQYFPNFAHTFSTLPKSFMYFSYPFQLFFSEFSNKNRNSYCTHELDDREKNCFGSELQIKKKFGAKTKSAIRFFLYPANLWLHLTPLKYDFLNAKNNFYFLR